MNYIPTEVSGKVAAHNLEPGEMSPPGLAVSVALPGPHWFLMLLPSVFLCRYNQTQIRIISPIFLFFFNWKERRIHTVLYFTFSPPMSLRSFHFCTERASSFFFHCIPCYWWAILYLTRPQHDGHLGHVQVLLLQTASSRPFLHSLGCWVHPRSGSPISQFTPGPLEARCPLPHSPAPHSTGVLPRDSRQS